MLLQNQAIRDQLRERHEEHERGLKEVLASKAQSSRASLLRRRQERRRSTLSRTGTQLRGRSLSPSCPKNSDGDVTSAEARVLSSEGPVAVPAVVNCVQEPKVSTLTFERAMPPQL